MFPSTSALVFSQELANMSVILLMLQDDICKCKCKLVEQKTQFGLIYYFGLPCRQRNATF